MNKNDDQIKSLLEAIEKKEQVLGSFKREVLQTNGLFKYDEKNWFNINTISDKGTLVNALAFLIEKQKAYSEASERLGIPSGEFVWDGYSLADWERDFKARVEYINWDEAKKSVNGMRKKLNSLISSEGKTEMEIESIKNMLDSI